MGCLVLKFTQFMDELLLKLGFLSVGPSTMWLHLVMPHPWCENTVSHHCVDLAASLIKCIDSIGYLVPNTEFLVLGALTAHLTCQLSACDSKANHQMKNFFIQNFFFQMVNCPHSRSIES